MRKQPNILFIMADQFRWDGIGKVGGWANTPALNRIAEEGLLFANCITNSPVCIPARVSLATGLYPHNTGVWSLINYDMPEKTNTWMQAIQSVGYRTSLFGKTHWHRHEGDLRDREHLIRAYGFDDVEEIGGPRAMAKIKCGMTDVWEKSGSMSKYIEDFKDRNANKRYIARPSPLPLEEYSDVYIAQRAKAWLEDYNDSSPWFCMLSFGGPHEPWDAPEPYASMYVPDQTEATLRSQLLERIVSSQILLE